MAEQRLWISHGAVLARFLLILVAFVTALPGQVISFNAPREFPSGYGPSSEPDALAVGDFNGDGKPDLALVLSSGTVSILLGQARRDLFEHALRHWPSRGRREWR